MRSTVRLPEIGNPLSYDCQPETRRQISAVLFSNRLIDQLIWQMNQTGFDEQVQAERISDLLKRFSNGFVAG